MDERLDDLIAPAAPPIPLMAGGEALLGQIVAEAQLAASARRLPAGRRWCLTASALLVAVGVAVGLAAAAHQLAAPIDGAAGEGLRILTPMVAGRMCKVSFTATSQSSRAGEQAPEAALTVARTSPHCVDPTLISESVRDGFVACDQAAAETAERPPSAAAALGASTQRLQAVTREAGAGAGPRAEDVRILPSVPCAAVSR